jgi:hypothetical protein
MKIRRDSVFISAVLFTIALVCALPRFIETIQEGYAQYVSEANDPSLTLFLHTRGDLGVASLAIILIALIVTWAGYAKCLRSAWFAMFIVVWGWAFPLLALPLFRNSLALTFSELLYGALHGFQYPRIWVKEILIFSLMVIALLLPIKSFFVVRGIREPRWRLSPRFIGFSVAGALVIGTMLLAWINFRPYEIPPAQLTTFLIAPPPTPTPAQLWLSWSTDEKYGYVRGYLTGFQGGKRLACSFYEGKMAAYLPRKPLSPEKLPQQVCLTGLPNLIETHENAYVDTITNYYTKYPHDREAEVSNILNEMATPSALTDIDQIHANLGGAAKRH